MTREDAAEQLRLDDASLPEGYHELDDSREMLLDLNLRGYTSGNSEMQLRKSPISAMVGYGLKMATRPCKMNVA